MANTIHWATRSTVNSVQESYGDRVNQRVEFTTDLTDTAEIKNRLEKAVNAKFPFWPLWCTNQHSGFSVELTSGRGVLTWETYHSIGD